MRMTRNCDCGAPWVGFRSDASFSKRRTQRRGVQLGLGRRLLKPIGAQGQRAGFRARQGDRAFDHRPNVRGRDFKLVREARCGGARVAIMPARGVRRRS